MLRCSLAVARLDPGVARVNQRHPPGPIRIEAAPDPRQMLRAGQWNNRRNPVEQAALLKSPSQACARREAFIFNFAFCTDMENSSPTIRAKRVDHLEKCGFCKHWRTGSENMQDMGFQFLRKGPHPADLAGGWPLKLGLRG